MKKVLFVSSEAIPYMKTGGLADVVGSLPRYFNDNEYDVRVILPKFACMDASFLPQLRFVCHFYVNLNWRKQYVGIFETEYRGVHYYFVDNEFYFAGPSPYGQLHEDIEKYAYFSKAVLSGLPFLDFEPDIIHCHDWQTGLLPVYLKTLYGSDPFYSSIKTVFSIHNLKFQGRWKMNEVMDITGLPEHIFNVKELESYGEANYLKGGIVYADAITTVSPTYARDITTVEGGDGLDGVLHHRQNDLYGIINGIDYEIYNPKTDPFLEERFTVTDTSPKRKNKTKLQKELGLAQKEDVFLVGMVSRLTDQKGLDLVAYALDELLSTMNIQFVFLGEGEERFENMLRYFQSKWPDKLCAHIGYSEERAHRIYASCDAILMPSLFEPCGLSQMMAMRYGTIPIVRETGGLIDTVDAYNEYEETGDGFSFSHYNAHEMMDAIRYAHQVYSKQKNSWKALMKRAMEKDFSWENSAEQYERLYNGLLSD